MVVEVKDYSGFITTDSADIYIKRNSKPTVSIYANDKYYTTTNKAKVSFTVHATDDIEVQKVEI